MKMKIICSEPLWYQPDDPSFDRTKVRARFLLSLFDDHGEPLTAEVENPAYDRDEPEHVDIPMLDEKGLVLMELDRQGAFLVENPAHDPSIPATLEHGAGDPVAVVDGKARYHNPKFRPKFVRARQRTTRRQNPRFAPKMIRLPLTHGYQEPRPPEGFEGVVVAGLEYDFPHQGSDAPFAIAGAPAADELRVCIARVARHWLSELQKPGGALGLPSASGASGVTLERFEVDMSTPAPPPAPPAGKKRR